MVLHQNSFVLFIIVFINNQFWFECLCLHAWKIDCAGHKLGQFKETPVPTPKDRLLSNENSGVCLYQAGINMQNVNVM